MVNVVLTFAFLDSCDRDVLLGTDHGVNLRIRGGYMGIVYSHKNQLNELLSEVFGTTIDDASLLKIEGQIQRMAGQLCADVENGSIAGLVEHATSEDFLKQLGPILASSGNILTKK